MLAKDVMHKGVLTCRLHDNLEQVAVTMWNEDCGALLITDDQQSVIGIITDRDIAMASALKHKPLWDIPVADVVQNRPVYTCHQGDDIQHIVKQMAEHRVRRMPVIDEAGHPIGVIATKDLVDHIDQRVARGKPGDLTANDAVTLMHAVCMPNALTVAA